MKEVIKTGSAPEAIGPYSQAVKSKGLIFTAGQIAISPGDNKLLESDIKIQTRQVLENLKAVLESAGSSLSKVLKTTVYLIKPDDFPEMNKVYAKYFEHQPPARTTVFVNSLPKGALIEIDAVAEY